MRTARQAAGLSQREVQEQLSISRVAVSSWENGAQLTEENLGALANLYGASRAWLRYGEGQMPPAVQTMLGAAPPLPYTDVTQSKGGAQKKKGA